MKKVIKKLYKGFIDLRDYDVIKCIDKNENMIVEHSGDIMTLSPKELKTQIVSTSKLFKSKLADGKDYKLISYEWNPDVVEI